MGQIGNSLSTTMKEILLGRVGYDDIEKIYAGTCFDEKSIDSLINEYMFHWESVAYDIAKEEFEGRNEASQELWRKVHDRKDELLPEVAKKAEELLHKLWDEGKIIQYRYRVPNGEEAKYKRVYETREGVMINEGFSVVGNGEYELINID